MNPSPDPNLSQRRQLLKELMLTQQALRAGDKVKLQGSHCAKAFLKDPRVELSALEGEVKAVASYLYELLTVPLAQERNGVPFTRFPAAWLDALKNTKLLKEIPEVAEFIACLEDQGWCTRGYHHLLQERTQICTFNTIPSEVQLATFLDCRGKLQTICEHFGVIEKERFATKGMSRWVAGDALPLSDLTTKHHPGTLIVVTDLWGGQFTFKLIAGGGFQLFNTPRAHADLYSMHVGEIGKMQLGSIHKATAEDIKDPVTLAARLLQQSAYREGVIRVHRAEASAAPSTWQEFKGVAKDCGMILEFARDEECATPGTLIIPSQIRVIPGDVVDKLLLESLERRQQIAESQILQRLQFKTRKDLPDTEQGRMECVPFATTLIVQRRVDSIIGVRMLEHSARIGSLLDKTPKGFRFYPCMKNESGEWEIPAAEKAGYPYSYEDYVYYIEQFWRTMQAAERVAQ